MAGASLSRGDLLLLVVVLGAFGIADSAYLAFQFYEAPGKSWCDLSDYFSCTAVRESPYASFAGIVLTLIEIFVIQAICILCVIGFALDLGILGLALLLRAAPAEGA